MLYTLVMLVCLKGNPESCEVREQFVDGLGLHPGIAFMQAQPIVARWIATHPGYVIRQWRLFPGRQV